MSNHPHRRRLPRRRPGPWRPLPGVPGVYVAPAYTPPPAEHLPGGKS